MTEEQYKQELLDMFDFFGNKLTALTLYSHKCRRYDCQEYLKDMEKMLNQKREEFKKKYCNQSYPEIVHMGSRDHSGKP